jgi:tetratricopeptide (TPR) repeat protein
MFEMLQGQRAFRRGGRVTDRVLARLREDPPPLGDDVPAELARLVASCCARAPGDRPSARDVEAILAGRVSGGSGEPGPRRGLRRALSPDLAALPGGAARRLAAARQLLLTRVNDAGALAAIDDVLELEPGLDVAVALRALALTRLWNSAASIDVEHADRAAAAVSRAVTEAPHLADTHVADALVADYGGDVAYAVRALRRALAREPLHAFSHEVLGRIELEGDVGGTERLHLAYELDAGQLGALAVLAREHLFSGQRDNADALLRTIEDARPRSNEAFSLRVRAALWTGDVQAVRTLRGHVDKESTAVRRLLGSLIAFSLGELDIVVAEERLNAALAPTSSPKRRAFLHQLAAETFASVDPARALTHVVTAAGLPLTDLRWLDACPALTGLREARAFRTARATVQHRIDLAFDDRQAQKRPSDVDDTEVWNSGPTVPGR